METIRSFIAIELPAGVRSELGRLRDTLKRAVTCPARWVAPDSIHLTLVFLGDVGSSRIEGVKLVMAEASAESRPFELGLGGLGAFPNTLRPQVVWVGIEGDVDRLAHLQKSLEGRLDRLGFRPDARRFSPHLTLARLRDEAAPAERQRLGEVIAGTVCQADCRIPVNEIVLMKSQLTPSGPIYTRLASAKLGG